MYISFQVLHQAWAERSNTSAKASSARFPRLIVNRISSSTLMWGELSRQWCEYTSLLGWDLEVARKHYNANLCEQLVHHPTLRTDQMYANNWSELDTIQQKSHLKAVQCMICHTESSLNADTSQEHSPGRLSAQSIHFRKQNILMGPLLWKGDSCEVQIPDEWQTHSVEVQVFFCSANRTIAFSKRCPADDRMEQSNLPSPGRSLTTELVSVTATAENPEETRMERYAMTLSQGSGGMWRHGCSEDWTTLMLNVCQGWIITKTKLLKAQRVCHFLHSQLHRTASEKLPVKRQ